MYKVGVIGLGAIAAMYGTPESVNPYCHVGGIRLSDKVELVAVADMFETARNRFADTWGQSFPHLKFYNSGDEMLSREMLDIIAVCVRGPHHHKVMMEVIDAGPKAIFLEKPPSCSLAEMDEMVSAAKAKGIPITVSYSRHWNPHILHLQQLIQDGMIGDVKTVIGYTGGGILSFASHTTDLICQFAGYCPTTVVAEGSIEGDVPAGYEPEPTLDRMVIEFDNGITGVQVGAHGEHGTFYCDVFGTKGSARVGMYIPTMVRTSEGEPIDLTPYNVPGGASVFTVAYEQIADYLDGGPLPHCTDQDFVTVNEIGFAAIESIISRERVSLPNQNRTRKVFANG